MSKATDLHPVTAETDTGGLNTDQYWLLLTQDTYHFCFTITHLDEKFTRTNMGGAIGNTGVEDVCLDLSSETF